MRIILDIMSGDRAPLEMLKGAVEARKEKYSEGVDFTLVGDENVIRQIAGENSLDISGFEIKHTDVVLDMHDDPMAVMKEKKDSSLGTGLRMLAEGEGDAFVSCGNTGALFCGSTLILKRVKGVQRAAIGAILPLTKPLMLMDSGASVKVNEDYLHLFGVMGSAYMKAIYGIEYPKVAMVNNGAEETKGLKAALGFNPEDSFVVPEEVYSLFAARTKTMNNLAKRWRKQNPTITCETREPDYMKLIGALPKYEVGKSVATRSACGDVLNAVSAIVPELIGGSADLGPSNKTVLKGCGDIAPQSFEGRNIHYGIRELAMAAIANGITAFGGFRGYGATFFVFSDYCRPAMRLAALMRLPSMFIYSHDSFYVGEDGPTHEPIEHLAALRTMPGIISFRPADATETAYAITEMLLNTSCPTCLMTTRQNVPVLEGVRHEGVAKGAYVIYESGAQGMDTLLFIATGSEVSIAIDAAKRLAEEGRSVRVVSMPSMELFLSQKCSYRETIIPEMMKKRVIVEAGTRFGWDRFRIDHKTTRFVTLDHYGASAPYKVLANEFGFTAENVYNTAKTII